MNPAPTHLAQTNVEAGFATQPFHIGVVVPTYNRAEVLLRCLQHLEAQTYQNFEVVVIDDGSTDNTSLLLAAYAAGSPLHLRCIQQQNAGAGVARNRAIALLLSLIHI